MNSQTTLIINISLLNPWKIHTAKFSTKLKQNPGVTWDNIQFQFTDSEYTPLDWTSITSAERQKLILVHSFLWRHFIPFEYSAPNEAGVVQTWIPDSIKQTLEDYSFELNHFYPHFLDPQLAHCFYGGTFNPWHPGHGQCVEMCEEKSIFILPDNNPLKMINRPLSESLNDIWRQTHLQKKSLPYLGFVATYRPNPTYPWLKKVKDLHPQKRLSLLVGLDSYLSLSSWFEAEKLMSLLHQIHVAPRSLDDIQKTSNPTDWKEAFAKTEYWIKKLNSELKTILLPHHAFETVSSTQLRDKMTRFRP
jgi:nicotinic acid mononucleotide adenylyltransferase